jgi:hypothetical protein
MVKRFCVDCKKEQIFDNSFDEDCNRCSECGCLPQLKFIDSIEGRNQRDKLREYLSKKADMEIPLCDRCKKAKANENYSDEEYGNFCERCAEYLDAQASMQI